jgi:hypothetical protein
MKAELLIRQRTRLADGMFVETVIWRVPEPVHGSAHGFKYRLALVVEGECVLRYDNEAGKGDHKHLCRVELTYRFRGLDELVDDFWRDVQGWKAS